MKTAISYINFTFPPKLQIGGLILVLSLTLAPNCHSQATERPLSPKPDRFIRWVIEDPVDMFRGIDAEGLFKFGVAGIAVSSIALADQAAHDNMYQRYDDSEFLIISNRISTRNRIIHGYDSISDDLIWSIVVNHLPKLKNEVETLLHK